ncbi:DUF488 domain-containing protein [Sphingobacterium faecale]|uniref:DUF488 family protein n=1 Tax=Sphingobacterium faecale TaxID=2803775 RepID=A0ABS1R4D1_9SPHI|nr:DUF488 family protein [Sphingobacterium faecale]MBL1409576.1 DUF488 family protein [Sphingobacterium faecale]
MIKIKRIYEEPTENDGYRMLVDRLWPRGISKDSAKLDEWNKDIAPSTELRKWFGHLPERFDEFVARYKQELVLKTNDLKRIKKLGDDGQLTLLYAAKAEKMNQAAVLLKVVDKLKETNK